MTTYVIWWLILVIFYPDVNGQSLWLCLLLIFEWVSTLMREYSANILTRNVGMLTTRLTKVRLSWTFSKRTGLISTNFITVIQSCRFQRTINFLNISEFFFSPDIKFKLLNNDHVFLIINRWFICFLPNIILCWEVWITSN